MAATHTAQPGEATAQALHMVERRGTEEPRQGFVSITARLVRAAEVRLTVGAAPRTLLQMELTTGSGLPISAQHDMGDTPAAYMAAHSKAQLLQAGDWVTVVCASLYPRMDHGTAGLVCMRVSHALPQRTARQVAA